MKYLQNFHGAFHDDKIKILPLAYLHNFKIEEQSFIRYFLQKIYQYSSYFRRNKGEIINLIERKLIMVMEKPYYKRLIVLKYFRLKNLQIR